MKKLFVLCLFVLMMFSCNIINDVKYRDLYEHTDYFIERLYDPYVYESYGFSGDHRRKTKNEKFQVIPIGRLINVKSLDYITDKEYGELCNIIKKHYEGNWKVKDVYICGYGTIMIDCRR